MRGIVLFLALLAFSASLFVGRQAFERVPHLEDEVAYLFQAKVFARGQAVAPLEFPKSAYWQPFVIEHENGTRFSKYPPGWSLVLAIGVLLGFPAVVNAALSALTVVLTYRLGREAFNSETGVVAAALMAFSPMALLLNGTLMAHTAGLFCATLFMWGYLRMAHARGRRALAWGALSGAALGLLTATRPLSAVAVALPFVVWSAVVVVRAVFAPHPPTPSPTRGEGAQNESGYPELVGTDSAGAARKPPVAGVLPPLVVLSLAALMVSALVPWYNAATTGETTANLYTMIPGWEYDRVGFGPDIGRNGHTLTKGVQFARYDLSLTAADLFGWQASGWTDMLTGWVNGVAPEGMVADSYWLVLGLSWVLLPLGLIVGFRREWAIVWVIFGALWLSLAGTFLFNGVEVWALVGIAWAFAPLAFVLKAREKRSATENTENTERAEDDASIAGGAARTPYMASLQQESSVRVNPQAVTADSPSPARSMETGAGGEVPRPSALGPQPFTWLLFAVCFALIAVHTAYWIGSQRYGTRYYAEGLSAACILAALPLGWLIRRGSIWRIVVPVGLCLALAWSYFGYSVPRISALRGYNRVTREVIEGVQARREGDDKVLVLVTGLDARWRTRAALWTLASPFLDADIEVAFVDLSLPNARESILARLPGRQIIEMGADVHDLWFMDTCGAGGCSLANPPVNPTLLTPASAR